MPDCATRHRRCLAVVAVAARRPAGARGRRPIRPRHPPDRAVPGRRLQRRGGAADCAASREGARPDRHRRQPAGGGRHRRQRRGGEGRARRPHAAAGRLLAHGHAGAQPQAALQHRARFRADLAGQHQRDGVLRQSEGAGEQPHRIRRARRGRSPGKFNYASPGAGSQTHLADRSAQPQGRHHACSTCPIAAARRPRMAVLAGEADFTLLAPNVLFPHIRAGTLAADRHRRRDAPSAIAGRADHGRAGFRRCARSSGSACSPPPARRGRSSIASTPSSTASSDCPRSPTNSPSRASRRPAARRRNSGS